MTTPGRGEHWRAHDKGIDLLAHHCRDRIDAGELPVEDWPSAASDLLDALERIWGRRAEWPDAAACAASAIESLAQFWLSPEDMEAVYPGGRE